MILDWDDAYANAVHIPDGETYPSRWAAKAEAFRTAHPPEILRYGPHPREAIDLFSPKGAARGLLVHVHGGYWRTFDRSDWSHLAAGPLARGWAVAMPGYALAPEARIGAITRAIARAVTAAADRIAAPIRLSGHSAGGHLVTRQVCADTALPAPIAARIAQVFSISGLHDLRPLLGLTLNGDLCLDAAEAAAESPALLWPRPDTRVHAWAGGAERPEFVRQAALLANIWSGLGIEAQLTIEPGRHHFDVIEALEDPDSAMIAALLQEDTA